MQLTARAKINLALHVTAQRVDGYHLLDSLVSFTEFGDELGFEPAAELKLTINGSEAGPLQGDADNLVLKAGHALRKFVGQEHLGAAITLTKNLPIAAGIGGGSADAAATLLGLHTLWELDLEREELMQIALELGADVPMCLSGVAARITSIGEQIEPLPVPPLNLVLINPRIGVSTPDVFRALDKKNNRPLEELARYENRSARFWINYLLNQRNDLQQPACTLAPDISKCLAILEGVEDCMLARMSGSGATCFGLFEHQGEAAHAAHMLRNAHPDWWVMPARTIAPSRPTPNA